MLIANLRQHGAVRLFATTLRGEQGTTAEVEISAVSVPDGEAPCLGFTIRDVGRRLPGDARGRARDCRARSNSSRNWSAACRSRNSCAKRPT